MEIQEIKKKVETELKIQGKSAQTIRMYRFFLSKFYEFLKKDIDQATEDEIKEFLAYLISEKNYDLSSVSLAKSALKFTYHDFFKKNIMIQIKTPKKQRKIPDILTKEEILSMLKHAGSIRNKLLIEFMYSSGLRVSEVAKLRFSDVNLLEKSGLLKRGKGGKDRFFILSEVLIKDLEEYKKLVSNSDFIFPNREKNRPVTTRAIQDLIVRIAKKAQIKKHVYCHLLRHSFATHLFESGTDIRIIQELLAHSNLQTTQFYTKVSKAQLKQVQSPLDSFLEEY